MTINSIDFGQLDDLISGRAKTQTEPPIERPAPPLEPPVPMVEPLALQAPRLEPIAVEPPRASTVVVPQLGGNTVAFRSLIGGTGKSVLALNFAFEAAALGNSVCLVDLDLAAPGLHRWFGLASAKSSVTAMARLIQQQRFDQSCLDSALVRLDSRNASVDLLTSVGANQVVNLPNAIEVLLEFLALRYQVVVIDVGTGADSDLQLICDRVATWQFLVVAADPVGLGRHLDAEASIPVLPNTQLVANRVRQSALGSRVEWQVSQTLGARSNYPIAALVPDHTEAVDHAVLAGLPLRQAAPKSPALLAISVLAANQLAPTRQSKKLGRLTKL